MYIHSVVSSTDCLQLCHQPMDSQTEQWNIELISLSAEEGLSHKIKCTFCTSLMSRQVFREWLLICLVDTLPSLNKPFLQHVCMINFCYVIFLMTFMHEYFLNSIREAWILFLLRLCLQLRLPDIHYLLVLNSWQPYHGIQLLNKVMKMVQSCCFCMMLKWKFAPPTFCSPPQRGTNTLLHN